MNRKGTQKIKLLPRHFFREIFLIITANIILSGLCINQLCAQSLDLAVKNYGVSFGNSKNFNGLRVNFSDREVEKINGVNVTFWRAKNNMEAVVNGVSLGLIRPEAAYLNGIQIGGLGVGAAKCIKIKGIKRITITAENISEHLRGSISGITIGGLYCYSLRNITGITIGGLGAIAIGNINGITFSGIGTITGGNITGITFSGIGTFAGGNITGFTLALLGAGANGNITGITIGGLGAGNAKKIKGITIGGLDISAHNIIGVALSLTNVKVHDNGSLTGFSASAFNHIKGRQTGVSLGIFNFAYKLNGIQIGLVNYVRENPKYLRILPVVNANFD